MRCSRSSCSHSPGSSGGRLRGLALVRAVALAVIAGCTAWRFLAAFGAFAAGGILVPRRAARAPRLRRLWRARRLLCASHRPQRAGAGRAGAAAAAARGRDQCRAVPDRRPTRRCGPAPASPPGAGSIGRCNGRCSTPASRCWSGGCGAVCRACRQGWARRRWLVSTLSYSIYLTHLFPIAFLLPKLVARFGAAAGSALAALVMLGARRLHLGADRAAVPGPSRPDAAGLMDAATPAAAPSAARRPRRDHPRAARAAVARAHPPPPAPPSRDPGADAGDGGADRALSGGDRPRLRDVRGQATGAFSIRCRR